MRGEGKHKQTFVTLSDIIKKGKSMSNLKPIAFRVDEKLVKEFRDTVQKSGFKQTYLITEAMKRIILELKEMENKKNDR